MSVRARLKRLEKAARAVPEREDFADLTEEGWLAQFEAWGREGHFDREPDFPTALAEYRRALRRAAAQADPPFHPPADFLPGLVGEPAERRRRWRVRERFPEVFASHGWLLELLTRLAYGVPPVSEAEFAELVGWFHANADRLYRLSLPSQILDWGGLRRTSTAQMRADLARGPRALWSGELAEALRQARARYGEGPPGPGGCDGANSNRTLGATWQPE